MDDMDQAPQRPADPAPVSAAVADARRAFAAGDFGRARRIALDLRDGADAGAAREILWRLSPDPVAGLIAVLGLLLFTALVWFVRG